MGPGATCAKPVLWTLDISQTPTLVFCLVGWFLDHTWQFLGITLVSSGIPPSWGSRNHTLCQRLNLNWPIAWTLPPPSFRFYLMHVQMFNKCMLFAKVFKKGKRFFNSHLWRRFWLVLIWIHVHKPSSKVCQLKKQGWRLKLTTTKYIAKGLIPTLHYCLSSTSGSSLSIPIVTTTV